MDPKDIQSAWDELRKAKASGIIPGYNPATVQSAEPQWREQSQKWLEKNLKVSPRTAGNLVGGPQGDLAGAGLADIPNTTGAAAAWQDYKQDPSLANSFGVTTAALPVVGPALKTGTKLVGKKFTNLMDYVKGLTTPPLNPNDVPLQKGTDFNTRYKEPRPESPESSLGDIRGWVEDRERAEKGKTFGDYLDLFDVRNMDLHLAKANDGVDPVKYTDILAETDKSILLDNKPPSKYDRALIGNQIQKAQDEENARNKPLRDQIKRLLNNIKPVEKE